MKVNPISSSDLIKSFERLPFMYQVFLAIGFSTGARVSEILQLKVQDFEYSQMIDGKVTQNSRITCRHIVLKKRNSTVESKTKDIPYKIYTNYLYPYFELMRAKGKNKTSYLFSIRNNEPITRMTIYNVFKRYFGSGYGTHFLRKTYATNLFKKLKNKGCSSFEAASIIQEELGHRYIETTAKYLGINETYKQDCKHEFLEEYGLIKERICDHVK